MVKKGIESMEELCTQIKGPLHVVRGKDIGNSNVSSPAKQSFSERHQLSCPGGWFPAFHSVKLSARKLSNSSITQPMASSAPLAAPLHMFSE
jgi:hypothetical protein